MLRLAYLKLSRKLNRCFKEYVTLVIIFIASYAVLVLYYQTIPTALHFSNKGIASQPVAHFLPRAKGGGKARTLIDST
jgi:hypothetical protein